MIKLGNNSIGKIYLGSNSIGKAYLGSNLVFQKGSSPTPPGPVVSVPYIRGGVDGSYIDTGITADNTVRVIVWARNWNPTSGFIFGSRTSAGVDSFAIGTHTNTKTGDIRIDYAQTNDTYALSQFGNLSNYRKYELYQGVCKVDDTTVATATQGTFSNQYNIHIIGINNGGTHTDATLPIDICACKIYKNDVLVRDYTAVNTPSVGLYDAVSGTVFTNAGTGSFTYGTFNPNAYTRLEYVESTEAQYFDTGIKGGYETPWVVVFAPTGTTAQFEYPVGACASDLTKRCEIGVGNSTYINARLYFNYQGESLAILSTSTTNQLTGIKITHVKTNNKASAYYESGTQIGSTVTGASGTSFVTDYNLYVGARNNEGVAAQFSNSKFYFAGFGSLRNFVPASAGGVAGMYDTYNDVFYPSETVTPFVAGPTI